MLTLGYLVLSAIHLIEAFFHPGSLPWSALAGAVYLGVAAIEHFFGRRRPPWPERRLTLPALEHEVTQPAASGHGVPAE